MRSPEELTWIFRARGLKVTPQRQAIFRVLHGSTVHPTAEAVYDTVRAEMPTISLRTVYQTLNDLAAMGEIQAIDLGTGSARFDPHTGPHHHLVCEGCGTVQDLEAEFPGVAVPDGNPFGFTVTTTQIVFRGRCRTCTAAPAGETSVADRSASPPMHKHTISQEATRA
ncbi:MAG TPA: transcriptional repressor [Acidimicrobiales bacterium]|nr:transcriptional repressor [Acidimicrobiales bacterium]